MIQERNMKCIFIYLAKWKNTNVEKAKKNNLFQDFENDNKREKKLNQFLPCPWWRPIVCSKLKHIEKACKSYQ